MSKKKLVYLILGAALICAAAVTVLLFVLPPSGTAQQDGLRASLTTDKSSYEESETIAVNAALTNTNGFAVSNVQVQLALDDGLTLKSGKQTRTIGLKAGETQTISYEVTAGPAAVALPGDGGLWLWLAIALGAALLILLPVLLLRRKRSQPPADMGASGKKSANRILPLVLVLLMLLPQAVSVTTAFGQSESLAAAQPDYTVATDTGASAAAQDGTRSFQVARSVSVGGVPRGIRLTFTYTAMAGAKIISFETNGGSEILPLMVRPGKTLLDTPTPVKDGAAFIGWYTDAALTQAFYLDTPIDQDMTLYAQYVDRENDVEIGVETTAYMEDCAADIAFKIVSPVALTTENLSQYVEFMAYTGDIPELAVAAGDGLYTITPVTPYTAGGHYQFTLLDEGLSFSGEDAGIREYAFRIFKEKTQIVELKDNIKYVLWEDVTTLSDGVYSVRSSKYRIRKGDVVCFWDGTFNNDTQMSNVLLATSVTGDETAPGTTVIYTENSDIDDVFEDVNIYIEQNVPTSDYFSQLDMDRIAADAKASLGTRQITEFLALALDASPSVQALAGDGPSITTLGSGGAPGPSIAALGGSSAGGPSAPSLADENRLTVDFVNPTENDDTESITFDELIEGLTVTASFGTAQNPNFYNAGPDDWAVLTLTFHYETVIKDKVEIKAEFEVKEYIKATMQGWSDKKGVYLEFDYALNMYTQTNISLSVLIRSKDNSEEGYLDVTEEMKKLTGEGEEKDDGSEVATILTQVLGNKGDDIDLLDATLFSCPLVLIPQVPIFQINFDLNFVVSVNFAAGISAETNLMAAKQIGICGNTKKGIETYDNDLRGGKRYDFDLYCAGYFGIKAGLKLAISLSFYGLKDLGEVGVSGEVGAYLDLYGFLHLHIDKYNQDSDDYNLRLQGGVYLEVGLYVKVKLFAKSKTFKAKAEWVPYEEKFKLLSVGDRYVLLNFANNGQAVVINTESYSIKDNPALISAEYLDLTTGKKVTGNYYDASKFSMTFSSRYFSYGNQTISVLKDRFGDYNTMGVTKDTKRLDTQVTVYYLGNNMTFTNDEYGYAKKTANLTWVDSSIDLSKYDEIDTVKATYAVDFGGKKTTLGSRIVLFGQVPGNIDMNEYLFNGTVTGYDNDFNQPIFEDTTYTVYIKPYQRLVSFLTFYGGEWHLDVYPVNAGSTPVPPAGYNTSADAPFTGWTRRSNSGSAPVSGVTPLEANAWKYYGSGNVYEGLGTTKPLYSFSGSYEKCENAYWQQGAGDRASFSTSSLYLYTANYNMPEYTVTFKYPLIGIPIPAKGWGHGWLSEQKYTFTFKLGQQIQFPYLETRSEYMDMLGWDTDDDGKVDYGVDELPMATRDMMLVAVEKVKTQKVTVLDKDGKVERTLDVKFGALPALLETVPEHPQGSDKYEFEGWLVSKSGRDFELWSAAESPGVWEAWTIKPKYVRLCAVTFDFAGGFYGYDETSRTVVVKEGEYTVASILSGVSGAPYKWPDVYNTYVFAGWSCGARLKVKGDITVTALYAPTPIEYSAEFHTERGQFVNGKTSYTFKGGYDAWQAFIESCLAQNSGNIAPVLTDDTVWSYNGWRGVGATSYTMRYDVVWKSAPREYTVTFNSGDGVFNTGGTTRILNKTWHAAGNFTAYNSALTKPDDVYTTFKLSGWRDQNGETYALADTYTVTGDMTFTAVYVPDERVEYTVVVSAGGGKFTDDTNVKTFKGYYGEPTGISVADPAYTIVSPNIYYVFSGWSNTLPTTFTADMTITALYDTMYYEYKITFEAGEGTFTGGVDTLEIMYHYDDMPSVTAPTRAEDDYFTYAFAGWSPPLRKVDGVQTYVATYMAASKGTVLEPAGIIVTDDGINFADINANHLPGEYNYEMEIAGFDGANIPVLRITGDGLTVSGGSDAVHIIIEEGVSDVTFNGLQLSGAYEHDHPLQLPYVSTGAPTDITIAGTCLFEATLGVGPTVRATRPLTLTSANASAELTVKSAGTNNSAFYCERGLEINDLELNVYVDAGGTVADAAAFAGGGIDDPVWSFNDAAVTVDSDGLGFNTRYNVEISGGTFIMQCRNVIADIGGSTFEVSGATLTASGAGGLCMDNGNVVFAGGSSQVHLTSTDNTLPVVTVTAYDAGTGYLRLTNFTGTFIADYTVPPAAGPAIRTETGIELLVSGVHSPDLFDLHGAVIALLNDGSDYYTFAVDLVPAAQVRVDR